MNNILFEKLAFLFGSIALYYFLEQITCYIIIIKSKEKIDFKNSKAVLPSFYVLKKHKVLYIVKVFILLIIVSISAIFPNETYYDRYGNTYNRQIDVIFYDRNDNQYKISDNKNYLQNISNGTVTNLNNIDEDGYVVDVSDRDIYVSEYVGVSYSLDDASPIYYYYVDCVYWDESGNLYYKDVRNDFLIKQNENSTLSNSNS